MKKILLFAALIVMGGSAFAQDLVLTNSTSPNVTVYFKNPEGMVGPLGSCGTPDAGSFTSSPVTLSSGTWSEDASSSYFTWTSSPVPAQFAYYSVQFTVSGCSGYGTVTNPWCGGSGSTTIICGGVSYIATFTNSTGPTYNSAVAVHN